MTLRDLIDELEDLAEDFGDDADVRLAIQPRWAFEYSIREVAGVDARPDEPAVIYIGEGNQLGYLPQRAAVALGWSEADDDEDEDDTIGGAR
jgi:hypothetical protein